MNIIERSDIDSELLRTFLAIAETRNLTQAANLLNRTQSAISVQIRKLEEALGTCLFHRLPRGMQLSESGHRLLPEARKLVNDVDRIARLFTHSLSGQITIGVPDDFSRDALKAVLQQFTARYPEVDVTVNCSFSETFPRAIQRGELDLALYTAGPDAGSEKIVCQDEMIWVASDSFLPEPGKPLPVALFNRECWWRDAAIAALENNAVEYRIAFSSESLSGISAAVHAGLAVAMLSRSALSAGMRILDHRDGLPALPVSTTVLLSGERQTALTTAMAEVIETVACNIRQA